MVSVEASIRASGLKHSLLEFVKLRAFQINGCAYCMHRHATTAYNSGDVGTLRAMLAQTVMLTSDGGEIANATINPIVGPERVRRLFSGLIRKLVGMQTILLLH